MDHLPLIDWRGASAEVVPEVGETCRAHGSFYAVHHGVDESLGQRLEELTHRFFGGL